MSNQPRGNQIWKLERYARFLGEPSKTPSARTKSCATKQHGEWKLFENSKDDLLLGVTDSNHLLITYGTEVQENHSLWNAQSWIKGVCKGDSMLIIYKIQTETRRFRVKFLPTDSKSAQAQCESCLGILSQYFSFKKMATDLTLDTQRSSSQEALGVTEPSVLEGQTSIGKIAQVLSGDLKASLPLAYNHSHIPQEELGTFVRLCLSDSNFPAFVGQVERELASVVKDTKL